MSLTYFLFGMPQTFGEYMHKSNKTKAPLSIDIRERVQGDWGLSDGVQLNSPSYRRWFILKPL